MKRYLLAAMASVVVVGFVMAEEFTLQITAVGDDGALTGKKVAGGKGGKGGFGGKAEEITVKDRQGRQGPQGQVRHGRERLRRRRR